MADRPLNSKGKIDLEIEVSSHSSAEQFPNMLRYLYGGGLTLNKDTGKEMSLLSSTLKYTLAPGLLTLAVKFDIVSIRSLCDRLVSELIEDADLDDALVVS